MNTEAKNYINSIKGNLIDDEYYIDYSNNEIIIEDIFGNVENWSLDSIQQAINGHQNQQIQKALITIKNLLN